MKHLILTLIFVFFTASISGQQPTFSKGPLIEDYGMNISVKQTHTLSQLQQFNVVFDLAEQGEKNKVNPAINSLARFLNMHVKAGLKPENIKLALVVHGKAGFDIMSDAAFQKKFKQKNPNSDLIETLLKYNVRFIMCGQSAAYSGIANSELAPGVEMALSAMTAHAVLQQQGYTLNPF